MDLTMCKGENCPIKNECLRHIGTESLYQAFYMKAPYKDGACEKFIRGQKKN